jgi:anaerobic dimethyl sulfoxide reductase subunit A
MKTVMTFHHVHCVGACMLKLHLKNGDVKKITSHGDIPREGSYEKDESLLPIQRRACLKGLAEINRIYAPDRLKFPLKQTAERGNIRGFKRISWDEALDTIASWYREMINRKDDLGYLPIWDNGGIAPYLGPYLKRFGNFSFGNLVAGMEGSIGDWYRLFGNPTMDIFNSNYIIIWANDIPASMPMFSFIMMKAKEAGIPITVVESRVTDTVSSMATGFGDVPGLICVRPGTDAALLSAMANVIYRKSLHDESFLRNYCFGFFPGDNVRSRSPLNHPVSGEPFAGKIFTVPGGQSFIEYLNELQDEHGGYTGVLRWAAQLTGTPADVIEKFAVRYAEARPAFIYSRFNGGAQRTRNGMYFSWMLIALSAMTGNLNKRGGGFGEIRLDDGYTVKLAPAPALTSKISHDAILFSVFKSNDVILNGLDGRTSGQLREDVLAMNKIDLGPDARLKVEMFVKGAGGGDQFNQVQNINKRVLAWKKLKYTLAYERFMTSTAAWSDIVLPSVTTFEESYFMSRLFSDTFVVNGPIDHMYEAKPDRWINEQIAQRLGMDYGRKGLTDRGIMEEQWSKVVIPDSYKQINPDIKLPDIEEIIEAANLQLPVPVEKTVVHAASVKPGEFETDTGMINFYSPLFAERNRLVSRVARAQYVKLHDGYEEILENGGKLGATGIKYTLQFITPHVSNLANSAFDNIPVLKEQRPHAVEIHPNDAAHRNISDGDMVYAFNDFGCIKLPANITRRIMPGIVAIGAGAWYRPSTTETYEAWFDTDCDGKPEKHVMPVDVGGCVNSITEDLNSGNLDPFSPNSTGLNAGGALCEVSKVKPQ